MTESVSQQVRDVLLQEDLIRHACVLSRWVEQWRGDLSLFHQRNETRQENVLRLEPRLVIRIGDDVKDISEEVEEVLLVELVGNVR